MVFRSSFLDHETLRRLDVLEVDAAEGRLEYLAGADDLAWVFGIELDIEHVRYRRSV